VDSAADNAAVGRAALAKATARQALTNGKVWLLSAVYFGVVTSVYGVSLWLPLIIEDFSGLGDFAIGLLAAVPYVAAAIGMVLFARHSDATGERRWHVAVAAFIAAVGLVLTGLVGASEFLEMSAITIAAFGIYSTLATFWSLPTAFLSDTAAAAGIALINSVGNLGGFYAGLLLLAALILIAGLLALAVRHERSLEQVEEVVAPIAGTPTSG
jgi:MFS transporter, ACS family, tartrate transporter